MITAYPLAWPTGWPRTANYARKHGKFGIRRSRPGSSYTSLQDVTIAEATQRVLDELQRMGIGRDDIVISTNLRLRLDGLPRSDQREPDDGGVAVYWETRKGDRRVMAIDGYYRVADNLAAIAATLDAMRAIERHGGAQILDRAFTGFTALPAPSGPTWREVMTFGESTPSADQLKQRYRELASSRHPDKGGSNQAMAELNASYEQAKRDIAS
jgi:hypothetical protein